MGGRRGRTPWADAVGGRGRPTRHPDAFTTRLCFNLSAAARSSPWSLKPGLCVKVLFWRDTGASVWYKRSVYKRLATTETPT